MAEQQPKRNSTHEEVGEVFIERDFLPHGRQGVGDAENIIKICNVIHPIQFIRNTVTFGNSPVSKFSKNTTSSVAYLFLNFSTI